MDPNQSTPATTGTPAASGPPASTNHPDLTTLGGLPTQGSAFNIRHAAEEEIMNQDVEEGDEADDDFNASDFGDQELGDEAFDFEYGDVESEDEAPIDESPLDEAPRNDIAEEDDGVDENGADDDDDEENPREQPYVPRQYTNQDERVNHTLSISPIRREVFGYLDLDGAMNLERAAPIREDNGVGGPLKLWKFRDIRHRVCESPFTGLIFTRVFGHTNNAGWLANPPPFQPAGHVHPPCTNDAIQVAPNTGRLELSMCQCPHDDPRPGTHPHPNPHSPLVCTQCKGTRYLDREWRIKELWFGVCQPCANWLAATNPPGPGANTRSCHCEPEGRRHPANINGGAQYVMEMCRSHDQAWWTDIEAAARDEIYRRRHIKRKWKKKNPYKVNKSGPPVMTAAAHPNDRAKLVAWTHGPPHAIPRCFCGGVVSPAWGPGPARHWRDQFGWPTAAGGWQARNCVGCRAFVWY